MSLLSKVKETMRVNGTKIGRPQIGLGEEEEVIELIFAYLNREIAQGVIAKVLNETAGMKISPSYVPTLLGSRMIRLIRRGKLKLTRVDSTRKAR